MPFQSITFFILLNRPLDDGNDDDGSKNDPDPLSHNLAFFFAPFVSMTAHSSLLVCPNCGRHITSHRIASRPIDRSCFRIAPNVPTDTSDDGIFARKRGDRLLELPTADFRSVLRDEGH